MDRELPDQRELGRERARGYLGQLGSDQPKPITLGDQLLVTERLHESGASDPFVAGFLEVVSEARQREEAREAPAKRRAALRSRLTDFVLAVVLGYALYTLLASALAALR